MSETTPRDYLGRLLVWFVLWLGVLLACITLVSYARGADDRSNRDRKARVALALAGSTAPREVAVAPAPREAAKLPYPEGHRTAAVELTPLVVFVKCDGPKPKGAITSKADSLGDVTGPAVVVAYPMGDRLYPDRVIPAAEATPEEVQKAVDAAARKLDSPPRQTMPALPKPLDWQIRSTPAVGAVVMVALVADLPAAKPVCICGDRCECEEKGRVCPGQCPVAVTPPGFGPAPSGLEWWRDPRGPGGWGLRQVGTVPVTEATRNVAPRLLTVQPQQNCPGGRCPNVVSGGVIVRPTNPLGR